MDRIIDNNIANIYKSILDIFILPHHQLHSYTDNMIINSENILFQSCICWQKYTIRDHSHMIRGKYLMTSVNPRTYLLLWLRQIDFLTVKLSKVLRCYTALVGEPVLWCSPRLRLSVGKFTPKAAGLSRALNPGNYPTFDIILKMKGL